MENLLKLSQFSNGELTKLRRRQQRQRQKAIVLVSKKTTLHVHHAFLYIPLPSLHDYHVKWPNLIIIIIIIIIFFFFFLRRQRQGDKFYHLCLHSGTAPLFSSNRNSLFSSDWVTWDNREVVLKDAKSIFQRRFHWRRRCRIVRSLLLWKGGG